MTGGTGFSCRSCGAAGVTPVLDLGTTPLANALLTADQLDQPEPRYPLRLVFCPTCTLVQIDQTVPPEVMFSDYLYFSSFSDTMLRHAQALAGRLAAERKLSAKSLVVEAASNDGYLLQFYQRLGVRVLGVEPAKNIADAARAKGIETLSEFFGETLARRLAADGLHADVIHAHNVLAHVPDLNGFVAGLAALLKPTGVAVIEAPYLRDMIENVEFDTIYHEHLSYFSLTALDRLFRRHALTITDVQRLPIHGGSLRIFAQHAGSPSPAVTATLKDERSLGMDRADYYRDFAAAVQAVKTQLLALIEPLKAARKTIAVYGASAKGSTLLNYFGIGRETLAFVADRSTAKQGRFTPGTHLPIVAPEELLKQQPDYALLLTWNFRDEILAQQAEYRRRGGKFIVPIPRPEVV